MPNDFDWPLSPPPRRDENDDARRLYIMLKKRVFDQWGVEVTEEWERRVLAGEHDVPLPRDDE